MHTMVLGEVRGLEPSILSTMRVQDRFRYQVWQQVLYLQSYLILIIEKEQYVIYQLGQK